MSDPLDPFYEHLVEMADQLTTWLDDNTLSKAAAVFFLTGVIQAIIKNDWPDPADQPNTLSHLMIAIERLAAELGPAIALAELARLSGAKDIQIITFADVPVARSQKKSKKPTVN